MAIKKRKSLHNLKPILSASKVSAKRTAPKLNKPIDHIVVNTGDDPLGDYLRALPTMPVPYVSLVTDFILPQTQAPLELFGRELRITPMYSTTMNGLVSVNGVLCEVNTGDRAKRFAIKKRISGQRTLWYGMIKFFVKTTMEASN